MSIFNTPSFHRSCFTIGFLLVPILGASVYGQGRDRFRAQRLEMVNEFLVKEGISNRRVLSAMKTVPRHEFVRIQFRRQAYQDTALAIGYKQTISPPFIVAYMTETIDPQPKDRILEIGTGSGYQAAVLSELAKEVYSIEIVEPLGKMAKRLLKKLDYDNVYVKVGDGYKGWPEKAPFDKIIVTCSPENVPKPLVEQLREGGKMVIPLGERYQQVFYLFEKKDGRLIEKKLIPTLFVPMTGVSEEQRRVQPNPLNPQVINGGFELDANDDGRVDHWHYQRQVSVITEDAPEGKQFVKFKNSEVARISQMLQGVPMDGRRIGRLTFSLRVQAEGIVAGPKSYMQPALMIHFYDTIRREVGDARLGPFTRDSDWHEVTRTVKVPANARSMIVRIGLLGASGMLCVDDIKVTARPR